MATDSLEKVGTENTLTQTMTITPEQFEKLYLSPKTEIRGDLRKTFGNPTPLALMGFVMALSPLSISLMGWRGAAGGGVATTGDSLFFGGLLLIVAGILEFILGNTFPFIVFMGYGAHFLTYGTTFIPWFNAVAAFTPSGDSQVQTPAFLASFGFYAIFMALLSLLFLVCSIRTNLIFMLVFLAAFLGFTLATGAFWNLAHGNVALGDKLLVGTGAAFFAAAMLGWYMLFAVMMAIMGLPSAPVFDLSVATQPKDKASIHHETSSQAERGGEDV